MLSFGSARPVPVLRFMFYIFRAHWDVYRVRHSITDVLSPIPAPRENNLTEKKCSNSIGSLSKNTRHMNIYISLRRLYHPPLL